MGKRLTDCITSQYIGAANRLGSKSARRRIVAYVESYDDIFFWRSILTRFENEERYFEVLLPTRLEHLERGKKAAIMSMIAAGGVGRNMIACVDADYDYVAQGATYSSKTILDNPYIFHSYAYAIENMQCYAPSLHDVCVAVTLNDAQKFDFEAFLADFSTAIFPLFVWNVWSYRNAAERRFTISDFIRSIEMGTLSPENASAAIAQLRRRVAHKVKVLQNGITTADFNQRPEDAACIEKIRKEYEGKTILLFVGRLIPYKGVDKLIEAEPYIKNDVQILVAGEGYFGPPGGRRLPSAMQR